jgi:hypothetical protein
MHATDIILKVSIQNRLHLLVMNRNAFGADEGRLTESGAQQNYRLTII